jgi:preprotein translocase subunit SecA
MLTRTIENAQKKVEQQNFLIRKRVLEYDDVMNEQRRVVYKYRREILEGRDMSDAGREELAGVVDRTVNEFTQGEVFEEWDLGGLESQVRSLWPLETDLGSLDANADRQEIIELLTEDALRAYDAREEEFGAELMRHLERQVLLQIIDNRWREHLYEMDYLREGIHLRGFAQIDPLVAYKNEGFSMFEELMAGIWSEFARVIFHLEVNVEPAAETQPAPAEAAPAGIQYSGGGQEQPSAIAEARAEASAGGVATGSAAAASGAERGNGDGASPVSPAGTHRDATTGAVVKDEQAKIGRNDPCWCGSGKKYKKCHGA